MRTKYIFIGEPKQINNLIPPEDIFVDPDWHEKILGDIKHLSQNTWNKIIIIDIKASKKYKIELI